MPGVPCGSGEFFATFAKVQPFLDEIRRASDEPDFCMHLEKVVMADQNASAIMRRRREAIRAAAKSPIELRTVELCTPSSPPWAQDRILRSAVDDSRATPIKRRRLSDRIAA